MKSPDVVSKMQFRSEPQRSNFAPFGAFLLYLVCGALAHHECVPV